MHPSSQVIVNKNNNNDDDDNTSTKDNMKVATDLSKYCAYLLFFAPSLLPFPALEAENICNTVTEEAAEVFKKSVFACCKTPYTVKHERMMDLINQNLESGDTGRILLRKGSMLGNALVNLVEEEKRWRILAELWAEMILYLSPSNNNETAHAEKLSEGGEFITHLWALLIHAGITDRDDMAVAFQQDDVSQQRT